MWSVVIGSALWLVNASFNFAAKDYRAFCINLLYVVCLLTLGGAYFRKEKDIVQGNDRCADDDQCHRQCQCAFGNAGYTGTELFPLTDGGRDSTYRWSFYQSFHDYPQKEQNTLENPDQSGHRCFPVAVPVVSGYREYRFPRLHSADD